MGMLEIALMLFLIANPIGGIPVFVSLVKDFDFHRQKVILLREAFFSLALAYIFLFLGEPFLQTLHIDIYAMKLGGGIVIFLLALNMIFPVHGDVKGTKLVSEPFVVPIAIPLISGAGVFTSIVVASKQAALPVVCCSILIAWIPVILIVAASAYFQKLLGKRGLIALEQLMGMILMMLAVSLFLDGIHLFMLRS